MAAAKGIVMSEDKFKLVEYGGGFINLGSKPAETNEFFKVQKYDSEKQVQSG